MDDVPLMDRVVLRGLGDGYEVIGAQSATEAAGILWDDRRLDGAFIDIGLSDGDGFALAALAMQIRPGMPVVLMTGAISPERVNQATLMGARLVAKPIERWMLRKALEPELPDAFAGLVACVGRHPCRWRDSTIAAAAGMLECQRDVRLPEWPDILDRLDRELAALCGTEDASRGHMTIH